MFALNRYLALHRVCASWPHRLAGILAKGFPPAGKIRRLQGRRKGDPRKVRIAAHLRRETTLTLEWTAERRCMGPARECQ